MIKVSLRLLLLDILAPLGGVLIGAAKGGHSF